VYPVRSTATPPRTASSRWITTALFAPSVHLAEGSGSTNWDAQISVDDNTARREAARLLWQWRGCHSSAPEAIDGLVVGSSERIFALSLSVLNLLSW